MLALPSTDLIRRYGRAGPRYTSYPAATEWKKAFDESELTDALTRANESAEPVSVYVHVPFCPEMCRFCGCNVIATRDRQRGDDYLSTLEQEAALWAARLPNRRTLSALHLGGGTPTFLRVDQLQRLYDIITRHFTPTPDAELALEIDPAITTPEQLQLLGHLGFRRLSMGVQDLDPKVQKAINRIQTDEETARALSTARQAGFTGVNMDLIYGLPYQSAESFANTIERVIAMNPDRLALFGYAHVPWLKPNQRLLPEAALPQATERLRIFLTASQMLEEAGYRQIGLDHFAREDDTLAVAQRDGTLTRNFQGYAVSAARDTVAMGVSAISDIGGAFAQNSHRLVAWTDAIGAGRLPVERGFVRSADDDLRAAAISRLMCLLQFDVAPLVKEFGEKARALYDEVRPSLQPLADDGLIEIRPGGFDVTILGRLFLRNIAMCFDAYLPATSAVTSAAPAKPMFSQTI